MTVIDTIHNVETSFGWNPWCIFFVIPLLIGAYLWLFGHSNRNHKDGPMWKVFGYIFILLAVCGAILSCANENKTEYLTYQVILNNEVDMPSFAANYIIVEQRGTSYIVRPNNPNFSPEN